jgi:hypothetical protein
MAGPNAAELAEAGLTLVRAANAHTDLSARPRLIAEAERVLRGVDCNQFSGHSPNPEPRPGR